jgi:hypothetical protein
VIQIENLNKYQVKILDHLWSLDTEEEVEHFINSFGTKRQRECRTLLEMLRLAIIDDEVAEATDAVKDLIDRIIYQ